MFITVIMAIIITTVIIITSPDNQQFYLTEVKLTETTENL